MNEISFRVLNNETIDDQIKVFRESFNDSLSFIERKKKWEAKHYSNKHNSIIVGAFDDNKLVSINAFMPLKYSYKGTILRVLESCESGTLPTYRGKHIWESLMKYALRYLNKTDYDFIIGFPNYKNSYHGFLKMKWERVSFIHNYIMITNSREIFKMITNNNIPIIHNLLKLQLVMIHFNSDTKYHANKSNCWIVHREKCDEENDTISIMKDKEFYKWKELYKGLKSVDIMAGDKIVSKCNYTIENYNEKPVICIQEILIYDSGIPYKKIVSQIINSLLYMHERIAFIRVWSMGDSSMINTLKQLLFFRSKHLNPFVVYRLNHCPYDNTVITNASLWSTMSFIDLD